MLTKARLLHSFYVFIKEVILGKATLKQAYKYDPRRVYVLFVILASLATNAITLPLLNKALNRIIVLKTELVSTQKALQVVQHNLEILQLDLNPDP